MGNLIEKLNTQADIKKLLYSPLIWLSLIAAFLYSSWPWGYILDPATERYSLASQLEAPNHPYSWVFVGMDVLTGLVLIVVGVWQLRKHPPAKRNRIVIISYLGFGILVMVAALTPLLCDPTTRSCGPLLHNYRVLVHGFASVASVTFLLAALLGVTINSLREHGFNRATVILGLLLFAWLVFGVSSLGGTLLHLSISHDLQNYFITLCSVTIVAVVLRLEFRYIQSVDQID